MKVPRREAVAEQRSRILDAARFLFGAGSFEEVTMADVARLAGVARATVFNHFRSKHAIADALTTEVLGHYEGMLERALALEATPVPVLLRALFVQMGAGIEQFYRFHRGVFREIAKIRLGLDPESAATRAAARAFAQLRRLVARGQERGELRNDASPDALASAFDALANGTIHHWLYDDTSGSLRDRMDQAATLYLGPVATQEGGGPCELLPELAPPFRPAARPIARAPRRRRAPTKRRGT